MKKGTEINSKQQMFPLKVLGVIRLNGINNSENKYNNSFFIYTAMFYHKIVVQSILTL